MAQFRSKIDTILKLVDQLSPDERSSLLEQLLIQELQSKVREGFDSADRGDLIPLDDAFNQLKLKNAGRHHVGGAT
jgi:hypothetical protein